jgi:hypothetical protein
VTLPAVWPAQYKGATITTSKSAIKPERTVRFVDIVTAPLIWDFHFASQNERRIHVAYHLVK